MIKELPGVSSADDIPPKFTALQKEVVDSMMKAGEAQANMKEVQAALDTAILGKRNAETEAAMVKEKADSHEAEIKRLELMLGVITQEREHLQNFVKELKERKSLAGETGLVSGTIVQISFAGLKNAQDLIFAGLKNSVAAFSVLAPIF